MGKKMLNVAILILGMFVAFTACRSQRRGVTVGGEAVSVIVTLNNLQDSDQSRPEFIYELSQCVGTVTGSIGEGNAVTFKSPGLKRNMNCFLRVRDPNAGSTVQWIGDEPGVMYYDSSVVITENAMGQLTGAAGLQQNYTPKISKDPLKSFTITVPASFPVAETASPIVATLECDEKIAAVGTYTSQGAQSGSFLFAVEIAPTQQKNYNCSTLWVSAGGDGGKYKGAFLNNGGKFTASAGADIKIPGEGAIVLTLVRPPTTDTTPVSVETTGDECKADEVFDISSKKCVKK